jgi:tripartite-type tricarboxylate transporter receptor subunit TctC
VLLNKVIKATPTMVPYRGTAPAMADVVSGKTDYICDQTTSLMGQVDGGTIKPLATLAPKRSPVLPNVPTAAEAGYPGIEMVVWNAVFAPKGTPTDIVQKLNAAISEGLDDAAAQASFAKVGAEAPAKDQRGPEVLGRVIAADVAKWSAIIKEADVKVTP